MATPKTGETAFNVELGNALRQKHPRWPDRIGVEQTNVLSEAAGLRPDLIVRHPGGLPVAVETEYAPAHTVERDACERLGKTLVETGEVLEQALAVRIPPDLAHTHQNELREAIETTDLQLCIFSGNPENPDRWPQVGWINGGVDDLAGCIELAALSENQIARGMGILEQGIGQAANRLRDACTDAPNILDAIAENLHQKDGMQTSRMAMAILANALTFHTAVAGAHQIVTLDELRDGRGRLSKHLLLEVWRDILINVNYWPIFKIASDILSPIRDGTARKLLDILFRVASELDELGATSQHDLCGRMFQRLIVDRKFLATFYTLPSSSALLAELAVKRLSTDWSDRKAVTALRVADFACGTGALLNAAYGSILSRHRRTGGDDKDIHPEMMEHALIGTDIMPAATHLTASVLSSAHPSVLFENTSVITLPYGKQPGETGRRPIALGALDLIEKEKTLPLFGTGQKRMRGTSKSKAAPIDLPHGGFDMVIMNPPFTRPTNHKLADVPVPSFAGFSTSDDEQKAMSKRLVKLRHPGMAGHGNASIASYFIDIAHAKLKNPGGVLALVLPASFVQGESWANARELIEKHYKDVLIVSIATYKTADCAFSADTGMAEVLVVATRQDEVQQEDKRVLFANLKSRPESILEAKIVARDIRPISANLLVGDIAVGGEEKIGHLIYGAMSEAGCAGVREVGVTQAAAGLAHGELLLPRQKEAVQIPVARLGDLGQRGLLHRDINGTETAQSNLPRGPFDIVSLQPDEIPTWPALWGHNAAREKRLTVLPDKQGKVRQACDERASEAWGKTASYLHFSQDFRLTSQPLAACLTPELSMGGPAWPNFLSSDQRWEVPLALWANTTLGLMSVWWVGTRQHLGRARLSISRLPLLAVLDARRLTEAQIDRATSIFNDFQDRELLPACEAWEDEARHALDYAVLIKLLELPERILEPLALLRKQWCAEPSVRGDKKPH